MQMQAPGSLQKKNDMVESEMNRLKIPSQVRDVQRDNRMEYS
jgi:hypothetical protein